MFTNKWPWYFFWSSKQFWITLDPNVYFPTGIKFDTLEVYKHIVAHELVHLRQQQQSKNLLVWYIKYVFNPNFRLEVETDAMAIEAYVAGIYGNAIFAENTIIRNAEALSSKNYLWCSSSKEEAISKIRDKVHKIYANPLTEQELFNGMFDE